MHKRKRDAYKFNLNTMEDLSEEIMEFDIYELFDGQVDNFKFIGVLIKASLSTRNIQESHLKALMVLSQYAETHDREQCSTLINTVLQMPDYEYLIDVVRNTVGDKLFKYPSVEIVRDSLVVKV